ncbi:MAG: hypothetical protein AAF468_17105 [Pseudomonadota bacterium]
MTQRFRILMGSLLWVWSSAALAATEELKPVDPSGGSKPSAVDGSGSAVPVRPLPKAEPPQSDGEEPADSSAPNEEPKDTDTLTEGAESSAKGPKASAEPAEILRDLSKLPVPVARMRELILEAIASGDIENLRPLIGYGAEITTLSLGGFDGDPVDYLKSLSGDPAGHEIMAILAEVLEAGFVHLDKGTENEIYVWPYFFALPLDALTAPQKVELFKLVTAGDYEDMVSFGAYIFYRVGITPDGRWQIFVSGD